MGQLLSIVTQMFFIPKPTLTAEQLPDQAGIVHLVTGGYAGIGKELTKILYSKNATVYVAGRNSDKGSRAIEEIKNASRGSTGKIEFLLLDLADLSTIKKSAEEFLSKESRLDVLHLNAGVMFPPAGSKDAQGHELQMGTNCLGPFLFAQCLLPILKSTAASSLKGSVRVTWAGSLGVQAWTPKDGMTLTESGPKQIDITRNYGQSKAGNFFLSCEFARRYGRHGIVSACYNPGNLSSELQRHVSAIELFFIKITLYPASLGALTELYAGCSPDLTLDNNGAYIFPWGRIATDRMRPDILVSSRAKEDGGNGLATRFWDWCQQETAQYA